MSEEATIVGTEYSIGFVLDYWKCHPEHCIVKIQGELSGNVVSLKGLVNVGYTQEIRFNDSVELESGDMIYCEPEGLTVLRAGATEEQIEPINGMKVQIGVYFKDTFIALPTVEP